jgi:hypothetical protein
MHVICVWVAASVVGIGSAKVSNEKTNPGALRSDKAPQVIYVDAFSLPASSSTTSSDSSDDSGSDRPRLLGRLRGGDGILGQHRREQKEETLAKLPGQLQTALVEDLNESIAPAKAGDGSSAPSHNCWVIMGRFTDVDTGNRALQAGVGFGAGKSELQVTAQVALVSDTDSPFLVFDSKKASGHAPGAVMTHNPYVAAVKFVMSKKQPDKEAKKIAQSIADAIEKFMKAQGIAVRG